MLRPETKFNFSTGQFIELSIPGVGEAPFTPSSNHNNKDTIDFTIMSAGRVTKLIHEAKPGDTVGLRGPYGLGYPLDLFKSKEVFIVGGGAIARRNNILKNEYFPGRVINMQAVAASQRTPRRLNGLDIIQIS